MTPPSPDATPEVAELVGVYHADGGPVGEVRYVIGKLLGTAHCALCDITHSPVRRKPAWDAMVRRLALPITLVHLNEMPADVAAMAGQTGTPVVLGRWDDGSLVEIMGPAALAQQQGSVTAFERALAAALDAVRSSGSAAS